MYPSSSLGPFPFCVYPASCPYFDSASSLHQDCGDRRLSLHTHLCSKDPERSGVHVGAVPRTAHRAATPHALHQHGRRLLLLRHTICDVADAFHG